MNLKNIIFIIYIILLLLNKGFHFWYPSLNINLLCHGTTCIEKALLFLFMTTALKIKQRFIFYGTTCIEKALLFLFMTTALKIKQRFIFYGKSYPNNNDEINIIMKEYISKRTQSDIDFFYLTDNNITIAFQDIIKENQMNKEDLEKIILSSKIINIIMKYKYIYNRARRLKMKQYRKSLAFSIFLLYNRKTLFFCYNETLFYF